MKWKHPLKGRTIKETLADALSAVTKKSFSEHRLGSNPPHAIHFEGVVSWCTHEHHSVDWHVHSWDCMKDCLKYGFDIAEDGEVVAVDNDWNRTATAER